ncbi:SLBB domain-containing protein [Neptuniibacter caesariensis]|uniref:Periplasmic protein involved in polysaccharide export n=1 Tax=Neptuniibacter caesariensis TaxID=207954 RepID=A0A7U8C879_NEPCE|nr:SLBB domain-containing protein [Neptuniibacter caesariensis]EAR62004.1 periplasmic protein involved in polysaccharide export [Oceanospirillum sp. MED92] [Neptuniibacter caesariensis]
MKTFIKIILLYLMPILAFATELRPGDRLQIKFPGESAFEKSFQLDHDGKISLPEIGTVKLQGMSLLQARTVLTGKLSNAYKDLSKFDLFLKERRLTVTVLGYVKEPGPVDMPIRANVQMAINSAGGLAQGAQLDKLQIRRSSGIIEFDYKHYLDSGDPSSLPKLEPMDVIFIPASPLIGNVQVEFDARTLTASGDAGEDGEAIKVFGEVHRPGTFAFKEDASVMDMIMRAGGVTRYAGIEQIRVIHQGQPYPFDMREYLDTGNPDLMPKIHQGDVIFIPQATEQVKSGSRTVYVMGEVFKPGAMEMGEGSGFYDLLATAGGPTRFAETRQIRIIRADGKVQPFDLQGYVDSQGRTKLPSIQPGDAILVPEKTDMNEKSWLKVHPNRAVRIIGAVNRPGRYEWASEMTLMDLIAHAGGPIASADTAHLQILQQRKNGNTESVSFDLKSFLDKGGDIRKIPHIRAGDTVVVPELPKDPNDNRSQWVRQSSDRSIYIFGEVGAPGRYAFNNELNFLDILSAAQGPTGMADLASVRITHRKGDTTQVTHLNLHTYFQTGDEAMLPIVKNEDVIFIPKRDRAWLEKPKETVVRVLGSVARPGRYSFDNNMTVLDLLAEAGGPQNTALQDRIMIINRIDGEAHSRLFDLVEFAKTGDYSRLPVLRAGDTVYVPGKEQSSWYRFVSTLQESLTVFSFAHLVGL